MTANARVVTGIAYGGFRRVKLAKDVGKIAH